MNARLPIGCFTSSPIHADDEDAAREILERTYVPERWVLSLTQSHDFGGERRFGGTHYFRYLVCPRIDEKPKPIGCDSCELLMIHGLLCHELGCRNAGKKWLPEEGQWARVVECGECGCEVTEGEYCCES